MHPVWFARGNQRVPKWQVARVYFQRCRTCPVPPVASRIRCAVVDCDLVVRPICLVRRSADDHSVLSMTVSLEKFASGCYELNFG
jgi:hypothetical protein